MLLGFADEVSLFAFRWRFRKGCAPEEPLALSLTRNDIFVDTLFVIC
nr:hypothetical protein DSS3P8_018 [Roseobacter phage DSS3P8]AWY09139.1 hypothetical protein vBRpoSV10_17 [Ruegeria phage vB_RpoS-V10]